MNEALLVSNVLLWIAVVVLAVVVLALTRQIGLLHERVAPAGALAVERGPQVGEGVPRRSLPTLAGGVLELGGSDPDDRRTLLFFLSPTCPVCRTLLPTLKRIAREETPSLRLVLASDGPPGEHRAFAAEHGLSASGYLLSRELGLAFEVARLPFAVLLDAGGVVRAKGLVNTREHLESLFEAERLAVGSIEQLARREAALEVVNR